MSYFPSNASRLLRGTALVLPMVFAAAPAHAYNTRENIGFPMAAAGSMGAPNGLDDDAGWSSAISRPLDMDGSGVPSSVLKVVQTNDAVYLYVTASKVVSGGGGANPNAAEALVVAFNPTGGINDYRKLIITPCSGALLCGSNSPGQAPTLSYIKGNLTTINGTAGGSAATGITVSRTVAVAGSNLTWSVEIKIEKLHHPFLSAGSFPFYVNAITSDIPNATAVNYSWPVNSPIYDPGSLQALGVTDLQEPRWGGATLDTTTFPAGLVIMGFSNTGLDPSRISLTTPNQFAATIANGPGGAVAPPAANNVRVRFQLNNIGLNPSWTWTDVPATSNPTAAVTVASRQYQVFRHDPWTPDNTTPNYLGSGSTQFGFYDAHRHQCVKVIVEQSGAALFDRYYNMNFTTTNSPFQTERQIATGAWRKGYPKAGAITLSESFYNVPKDMTWETSFDGAKALGNHRWEITDFSQASQRVSSKVLASDRLQLPLRDFKLDTAAINAGTALKIPVTAGVPVTVLAQGWARTESGIVTPAGTGKPIRQTRLMRSAIRPVNSVLQPGKTIDNGQLIGSFDGFQTSFPIASGATLTPPRGATTLQVKAYGNARAVSGQWNIQAVSAPIDKALLVGPVKGTIAGTLFPTAVNLPTYVVRGTLNTGEEIIINGHRLKVAVPMGSYGSYIYRISRGPLIPLELDPDYRRVIRPTVPVRPVPIDPVVRPVIDRPVQPAGPG